MNTLALIVTIVGFFITMILFLWWIRALADFFWIVGLRPRLAGCIAGVLVMLIILLLGEVGHLAATGPLRFLFAIIVTPFIGAPSQTALRGSLHQRL